MTIENLVPSTQSLTTPPHEGGSRQGKQLQQQQQPWQFLSKVLHFAHPDHQLWWDTLAPVFGSSLAITGYSIDAQYRHLLKIYAAIIPSLGPFPNAAGTNITWRSAIRPGPMEASVNYQGNGATLYRFTVEPTGPHAGTDADPVNDLAAAQLFQHLSHLQEGRLDLSAFGHLRPLLGVDGHEGRTHLDAIDALPCLFHTAIALDLKRDSDASYNVKLYLTPFMRAAMLATDVVSLLFDGLQHYRATTGSTIDFGHIEEFMRERQARLVLERTYVAVDCVDPRRSRMKIYTETAVTSLAEVYDFWTLGGRVAGPEIEKGFELVGKMWKELYPKPLPNGRQRDSMLVQMNWEISPDKPGRVSPKIYFTVIDDYDQYVSEAVVGLFKELGWSDQIQTHKRVEQEAYPVCHSNPNSTNCYMWIALAYTSESGPYVTVYTYPSANVDRARAN